MYYQLIRIFIILFYSAIFLTIDQFTKHQLLIQLENSNLPIQINKFFNLIAVWNTGFSFGFLSDYALNQQLIAIFTLVILLIVLYCIRQFPTLIQGLIFGGALGNIFDRFFHKGVLDFIDLHIYNWHYPAFNLADSFIVIAIIYIIINEVKLHYTEKKVIQNITKQT